jgi:hypothetical protein
MSISRGAVLLTQSEGDDVLHGIEIIQGATPRPSG